VLTAPAIVTFLTEWLRKSATSTFPSGSIARPPGLLKEEWSFTVLYGFFSSSALLKKHILANFNCFLW
jgi:hypothetical protein